jgi:AmmeMemoRadiSam system protein B
MALRRRFLPSGWYPEEPESLRALVSSWTKTDRPRSVGALAAVAPHAGWAFSGRLAALAVSSLAPRISAERAAAGLAEPPTVAVFGGHLPPGARPLAARESAFETPLGPLASDVELLAAFESLLGLRSGLGRADAGDRRVFDSDDEPDNTVEVLLPLLAALLPGSRVLWLRSPNDASSLELGQALYAASSSLGRNLVCLGSTDLTHYGPNYGFSPKGRGGVAEAWVRDSNDRRFIEALLSLDGATALERGEAERSACSPGAAVAALSFARAAGASRAELLEYATSLDVRRDDSFVGYGAIAFFE